MTQETLLGLATVLIGGINLAFLLKLLWNDLHALRRWVEEELRQIRELLVEHLRDHTRG